MNAFPTCFDFAKVAANHRHIICEINGWKIPGHIITYVYIFLLLYLYCTQWYCCRDRTGARSSSEIQEKRNGQKNNFLTKTYKCYKASKLLLKNDLAKSLFWHTFSFKSLNIGGVFRTQSNISDEIIFRK